MAVQGKHYHHHHHHPNTTASERDSSPRDSSAHHSAKYSSPQRSGRSSYKRNVTDRRSRKDHVTFDEPATSASHGSRHTHYAERNEDSPPRRHPGDAEKNPRPPYAPREPSKATPPGTAPASSGTAGQHTTPSSSWRHHHSAPTKAQKPEPPAGGVVFLTKKQREELRRQRQKEEDEEEGEDQRAFGDTASSRPAQLLTAEDMSDDEAFRKRYRRHRHTPMSDVYDNSKTESHPRGGRSGRGPSPSPSPTVSNRGQEGVHSEYRSREENKHSEEASRDDDMQVPGNLLGPHSGRPSGSLQPDEAAKGNGDPPSTVARAWDTKTTSFLSELDLLKLRETDVMDSVSKKNLSQIREHYLGLKKEKRKIQKPSEKFRNIFNFEWNAIEDTTRGDSNTLYQSRVEPQLLFGRGFRAGIDVREQRRHNNFYDELIKRRAALQGEAEAKAAEALTADAKEALIRSRDIENRDPNRKHWTEKQRSEMTDRDWRIFREDYEIYIKGGRVPPPIRAWEESGLPQELLDAVKACGYERPTPIQMQAIPISLEQRDLIGIAETGSGKTAAFVLPMLTYVNSLPPLTDDTSQDGPYSLVLAPSRELAIQIDEETRKFASFCSCRAVAVVGGRSAEAQAFELRRGAEIIIGTPGRIKDCLERSYTVLSQCHYVVLDEADRMIDLGFEEIVNWILDQIPSTNLKSEDENQVYQQEVEAKAGYRQYRLTHMFSATMPPAVERLTRKYLRSPAYISIGDPGAGKRAIEQRLEFMPEGKKRQRLHELLENAEPPIMVFVNQKKVADVLAKTLSKMTFSVTSLHGGKAQEVREQALHDFKKGDVDILVATDVAGRGIDVEGVKLVINFDMPKDIGSYTHRIGRTGRAGRKGLAVSFCTEEDSGIYYDLKQLLMSTNNVIPMELANHPMAKAKMGSSTATSTGVAGERSDRRNGVIS